MKLRGFVPSEGILVLKVPDGLVLPKTYSDPTLRASLLCVKGDRGPDRQYAVRGDGPPPREDMAGKTVLVDIDYHNSLKVFTLDDVGGLFILYPGYQILGHFVPEVKA